MATVASIKGSIFGRAVEDLKKLVTEKKVSRVALESILRPEGMLLFEAPVQPSDWYDVQVYGAMLDVLREVAGNGSDAYLYQRGVESAEALLEKGMYQQMEYLSRTQVMSASDAKDRFVAFGRDLNLLISLHRVIMNFGVQKATVDPDHADRYVIEFSDAAACPDSLGCTTTGFMNRMATQHGQGNLWTWSRPRRDLIVFRMTRAA